MTKEYTASRSKTVLMLLGSLGFVAIGIFVVKPGEWGLYCATAFFALCSMVFTVLLMRPQQLSLDSEGFHLSGGLSRSPFNVAWRDISEFFVLDVPPSGSMIAFNYNSDAVRPPRMTGFAQRVVGADAVLSGLWPGSRADVVDELNAFRRRALARTID